jgi:hypothetical protein
MLLRQTLRHTIVPIACLVRECRIRMNELVNEERLEDTKRGLNQ